MVRYASVNSSSAHPPPPRVTPGQSLGWGISNVFVARGWGICLSPCDPQAFDSHVVSVEIHTKTWKNFSAKTRVYSYKTRLILFLGHVYKSLSMELLND